MKRTKVKPEALADFEKSVALRERRRYVLRLYVAGSTPRSARAIENIKRVCEQHVQGRYDLEIIDLYQQPKLAAGDQIVAVPTLVKQLPVPLRRFLGDLSDEERLLVGLDLKERP